MKRYFFILLLISPFLLDAQNVKNLEQQKKKVENDIAYTNSLISKTKSQQKATVDNLNLIRVNISSRKNLIGNIDKGIADLSQEIVERQKHVAELYDDLARLKDNYAKMIVFAYRNRKPYSQLMYVLAADDLNQAYRRMTYLRSYSDHRIAQAKSIIEQSEVLNQELAILGEKKTEQEYLLNQKTGELVALNNDEKKYQSTMQTLQAKEKELRRDLEAKKKQAAKLNKQIQDAIAEEARREAARRREAEKKSKDGGVKLAAEEQIINAKFEKQRGSLPMPVDRGVIVTHFGVYDHPVLKRIKVTSNGIDISTTDGASVMVVADGTVRKVFTTGLVTSVLIQHGLYYTVYTHLKSVSVKAGDVVRAKQVIGRVTPSPDNDRTILHFELWRQTDKQDPELWLAK